MFLEKIGTICTIVGSLAGGAGIVWFFVQSKVKEIAQEASRKDSDDLKQFIKDELREFKTKTVTPEELERKHREILEDAEKKFVLIKEYKEMRELSCYQYHDIKESLEKQKREYMDCINKIFDLIREK